MLSLFDGGYMIGFIVIMIMLFFLLGLKALQGLKVWKENNRAPLMRDEAVILVKEPARAYGRSFLKKEKEILPEAAVTHTLVFMTKDHGNLSMELTDREARLLKEGQRGSLSWKGNRFIGFIREKG